MLYIKLYILHRYCIAIKILQQRLFLLYNYQNFRKVFKCKSFIFQYFMKICINSVSNPIYITSLLKDQFREIFFLAAL